MFLLTIAFVLIAPLFIYFYFVRRHSYWERKKVNGPKPNIFVGNLANLLDDDHPPPFQLSDWNEIYGPTYGIYEGANPVLVSSDLDLLHDVFVKKFDHFHGRKLNPMANDPDKDKNVHVFSARGMRWKRQRTITSPSFNVNNLKKMLPTVEDAVREMVGRMDKHASDQKPFDIYPYFQELTLDVIAQVALGHEESLQGSNPYLEICQAVFNQPLFNPFATAVNVLPEIKPIVKTIAVHTMKLRGRPFPYLFEKLEKTVKERKQNREKSSRRSDFIQLFLNAEAEDDWAKNGLHLNTSTDFDKTALKVSKKLTTDEIVAQCFVFLLAGFDTTANSLAYATYLLATNPEKQEKLIEEIQQVCTTDEITYDQLQRMKYMDSVVKEALRLYPLASFASSRICNKACTVGSVSIDEGVYVAADVWSIHRSKQIWGPDADQFVPERWADETKRHQLSWMPFGAGPRTCIGMRFAQLEEKLALAHIFRKYKIERHSKTEKTLKLKGSATISPERVTVTMRVHKNHDEN